MTSTVADRLFTNEQHAESAQQVLEKLEGPLGHLLVGIEGAGLPSPLPRQVGELIQSVLEAVAAGRPVNVLSLPEELTTSTAAGLLGISRPTLVKMVADGKLPARKVGTHTRLRTEDVLAVKRARRARERAAYAALLELEGDEDG